MLASRGRAPVWAGVWAGVMALVGVTLTASGQVAMLPVERSDTVRHFAGSYIHDLEKTPDGYRIKQQRVDMTNAQAAFDYVLQVWV